MKEKNKKSFEGKTTKERFKESWTKKDKLCPTCGKVIIEERGLTKQNLIKLFRKPNYQDWIIFAIMILAILGACAYSSEVEQYKEIIRNPAELCQSYYNSILHGNFGDTIDFSLPTNIKIQNNTP